MGGQQAEASAEDVEKPRHRDVEAQGGEVVESNLYWQTLDATAEDLIRAWRYFAGNTMAGRGAAG